MPTYPADPLPDSTVAVRADPYRYIRRRAARLGSDVFGMRLLLEPAICVTGHEAAERVYDPARFRRSGAAPKRVERTLFGEGGVQGLDGAAHADRKRMILSLMTPGRMDAMRSRLLEVLREQAQGWGGRVVLQREMETALTRAVCDWAGVPLGPGEVSRRTDILSRLFLHAGSVGPVYRRTKRARAEAERWVGGWIRAVREGRLRPPEDSALFIIATWRDAEGALLPTRIAAVDLLNVLRPVVAVSVYITFAAHALHRHPEGRAGLAGDAAARWRFVQEVRRLAPFFPVIAARVRAPFAWHGFPFPADRLVLLDVFGTNRDPRVWADPDAFRPERFRDYEPDPFALIPQGGGAHESGHRCAGEWLTIHLLTAAVGFVVEELTYEVPEQDLDLDWAALPALPRDRMILGSVQVRSG